MVQTEMIVRANDARRSSLGGPAVSEFAALEYRREDLAWVASQAHQAAAATTGGRSRWARLWRSLGTPRETERDGETIADPGPA